MENAMNLSLYQISAEYRESLTKLADLDLDEQTIQDTLESMGGELQAKATNVAAFCRDLEATAASIKDAEAQMKARRTAIENRATRLRKYLMDCMLMAEIQKIESPYFRLAIKQNPPSVEVFDERQVPQEYMKDSPPPPPTVDKTLVKQAIKDGYEVPGCRLVQGQRLEIA
jgi:hypothetical protein